MADRFLIKQFSTARTAMLLMKTEIAHCVRVSLIVHQFQGLEWGLTL